MYEKRQRFVCLHPWGSFRSNTTMVSVLHTNKDLQNHEILRLYPLQIPVHIESVRSERTNRDFFLSLFIRCSELVFSLVYRARIVRSGKNNNKNTLICDRRRCTRFNYYSSDARRCLRQRRLTDTREKKYNQNTLSMTKTCCDDMYNTFSEYN